MSTRVHLPLAPTEAPALSEARWVGLRPEGVRPEAARPELLGPEVLPEGDDEEMFQVGDLAKAVGRTVRAIHLYEELGLLTPHTRSKGRYRLFDRASLVRVRWIAKLQDLGLTLGEIQGIVREWEKAPSAPGAMRLMRDTYGAKLAETRAQIARLRALESELAASLHYLETCDTCDPARLLDACSCCDLQGQKHEPDLVAGFRAGHRGGVCPGDGKI